MKTVTLPLEEYDELLQDQKDKQRLIEVLEADAKERGFIVQEVTHVWDNPWSICYKDIAEKSKVKIISRDEVLDKAQKELERLEQLSTEQAGKIDKLTAQINILQNRGFFARLLNKEG